jgi:adenosylmethionine-8-amino-7-oxononanoate aminotransferase
MTQPTDPATNALAVQMEYGDEELKQAIDKHIREIAFVTAMGMANDPDFFHRMLINNASKFNDQVVRAMKDFHNNPRNIY